MRRLPIGLGLTWVLVASSGFAQQTSPSAAPAAPASPPAPSAAATPAASPPAKAPSASPPAKAPSASAPSAPAQGADGVRRDPKGRQGISPFMELIVKADRAYLARDFDSATATYREAIQIEPQNALGHLRMGQAQLIKGDPKEAEAAFVTGLRFVGADAALKAKLLLWLAELGERQKSSDEAILRWKEYAKCAEENREAVTYPATAAERISRNETWKKTLADSLDVKSRIDKRLKEADEASRKSASDPKNK